jgi:outer membrane efflux protein
MNQRSWTKALIMTALLAGSSILLQAQEKPATNSPAKTKKQPAKTSKKTGPAKPLTELGKLREEYVNATNEYKASLEKLRTIYEKNVSKAEAELAKTQQLFAAGLVSRRQVEANQAELAQAREKVAEADLKIKNADSQIADTLLEAEAETKIARSRPLARGALVSSTALIRYNGGAAWSLSDAWKVQRFFQDTFKKPLPIAVFGQGSIHDRWRLDHHNSMDVSLHPDGPEGQALLGFLRANGIPFLAFRQAIPGTATGPHIHVGRPSHRY